MNKEKSSGNKKTILLDLKGSRKSSG